MRLYSRAPTFLARKSALRSDSSRGCGDETTRALNSSSCGSAEAFFIIRKNYCSCQAIDITFSVAKGIRAVSAEGLWRPLNGLLPVSRFPQKFPRQRRITVAVCGENHFLILVTADARTPVCATGAAIDMRPGSHWVVRDFNVARFTSHSVCLDVSLLVFLHSANSP